MTDSGNSGSGTSWTATEQQATPQRAKRPAAPAEVHRPVPDMRCKRCGNALCSCPIILAEAISQWTGADYDTAVGQAERVWQETVLCRNPETEVPTVPVQRPCVYCGDPARKLPNGLTVVTKVSPGVNPLDDPTCPDSPTQRHALP